MLVFHIKACSGFPGTSELCRQENKQDGAGSATDENRPGSIWRGQSATSRAQTEREERLKCPWLWKLLTGNGAQVQVVPDHLLELMVQGALLKLQAEVVTQIGIQHLT